MQHAYLLISVALGIFSLYAFLMFVLKKKLKRLQKKFGGKVTSNIFGVDYILDDIELTYNIGSQDARGSTSIKGRVRIIKAVEF